MIIFEVLFSDIRPSSIPASSGYLRICSVVDSYDCGYNNEDNCKCLSCDCPPGYAYHPNNSSCSKGISKYLSVLICG